jgi:hypothetical protein
MEKLALMLCAVAASSSANAFDINSYCRQLSDAVGGSYQIEKACREQEYDAQSKISSMSVPSRIKSYCNEVGQAVGGSYQIMEACIQQELQAKSSLY